MKTTSKTKGFTIIEVVLVLAIAGLIFLMVFLALPALQRSQRDTQRKNDVARLASALQSYASNNQGALPRDQAQMATYNTANPPALTGGFVNQYVRNGGSTFSDPKLMRDYTVTLNAITQTNTSNATAASMGTIFVSAAMGCPDASVNATALTTNSKAAVYTILEGGGVYCANV